MKNNQLSSLGCYIRNCSLTNDSCRERGLEGIKLCASSSTMKVGTFRSSSRGLFIASSHFFTAFSHSSVKIELRTSALSHYYLWKANLPHPSVSDVSTNEVYWLECQGIDTVLLSQNRSLLFPNCRTRIRIWLFP